MLNGTTHLALTKLDVLSGFDSVLVGVGYAEGPTVPTGAEAMAAITPIYEELPGWDEDIRTCRSWDQLPDTCRAYIRRVEELVGAPVGLVSVGPGRDEVIVCDPLFGPGT